ncbi:hypothetical protein RRF57_009240 [Xylaria bambusicola]|uniref:Uncharacterized protein n=1 Tax=Xylaria bambusicola TaxID=326684 RepID=A0AAN7UV84_9PEZI
MLKVPSKDTLIVRLLDYFFLKPSKSLQALSIKKWYVDAKDTEVTMYRVSIQECTNMNPSAFTDNLSQLLSISNATPVAIVEDHLLRGKEFLKRPAPLEPTTLPKLLCPSTRLIKCTNIKKPINLCTPTGAIDFDEAGLLFDGADMRMNAGSQGRVRAEEILLKRDFFILPGVREDGIRRNVVIELFEFSRLDVY